jgi:hypothetical protein
VRLDVSVNDALLVKIDKSFKNLSENFPFSRLFLPFWILIQKVLKGFTFTILHLNVKYFDAVCGGLFTYHIRHYTLGGKTVSHR